MEDVTSLFNAATLSICLPASQALISSPPSSTSFTNVTDATLAEQTDAWVDKVLQGEQRASLYHDERLSFYLALNLPHSTSSSNLTRTQVSTLFLKSLPDPHLALSADLAHVSPPRQPFSFAQQQQYHSRPPLPPRQASLPALAVKIPLTPAPLPASLPEEGEDATATTGVPAASVTFDDEHGKVWIAKDSQGRWVGLWEMKAKIPFVRSQLAEPKLSLTVTVTLRDDPKLARLLERAKEGILPGEGGNGELAADDVLDEEEYMEEGWDDVNLLSSLSPISSAPLHLPLSRLPTTYLPSLPPAAPTHRPSRSRSYSLVGLNSLDAAPHHPSLRRSSRRILPISSAINVQMRTVPCPVGALGIPEGGHVWERDNEDGVVLCVEVSGPSRSISGLRGEGFDIESIEVMVEGGIPAGGAIGRKELQDIEVRPVIVPGLDFPLRVYSGGFSQLNFLYVLATVPSPESSLGLGARYRTGGEGLDEEDDEGPLDTVPLAAASSPSQRFAARFGAEEVTEQATAAVVGEIALRRGSVAPVAAGEGTRAEEKWKRRVAIVVKGRPVLGKKVSNVGAAGYQVPGSAEQGKEAADPEEEQEEEESPTSPFSSRWNCTLDISSFARRNPPQQLAFSSHSVPSNRPTSFNLLAPSRPLSARPFSAAAAPPYANPVSRPSSLPLPVEVESIAGSKRHTMSSLASLSLKSPVLNRRGSAFPFPPRLNDQRRPSRALPPTPQSPLTSPGLVQTPGATGPTKRFFSLPRAETSATSVASGLPPPIRTETPSPMPTPVPHSSSSALAGQRASLPNETTGAGLLGVDRPRDTRRTSWLFGGGGGGGGGGSSGKESGSPTQPSRASSLNVSTTAPNTGTSWDRTMSASTSTVGLGLDELPAMSPASAVTAGTHGNGAFPSSQQHQMQQREEQGKLLVSVSVVPLRQAKSRRAKGKEPFSGKAQYGFGTGGENISSGADEKANLPPSDLPGLSASSPNPTLQAQPQTTPRTTFSFPPPPSFSQSSASSPDPSAPPSPLPPPTPLTSLRSRAERHTLATSRMPRINLLDVFLVEVFVQNGMEGVGRFVVGTFREEKIEGGDGGRVGRVKGRTEEEEGWGVVGLEEGVRIGPLAPSTCASVGLRFLAIRPGAHCIPPLRLTNQQDGSEVILRETLKIPRFKLEMKTTFAALVATLGAFATTVNAQLGPDAPACATRCFATKIQEASTLAPGVSSSDLAGLCASSRFVQAFYNCVQDRVTEGTCSAQDYATAVTLAQAVCAQAGGSIASSDITGAASIVYATLSGVPVATSVDSASVASALSSGVSSALSTASGAAGGVAGGASSAASGASASVTSLASSLSSDLASGSQSASSALESASSLASSVASSGSEAASSATDSLASGASSVTSATSSGASSATDSLASGASSVTSAASSEATSALSGASSVVNSLTNAAGSALSTAAGAVGSGASAGASAASSGTGSNGATGVVVSTGAVMGAVALGMAVFA
ncbi:hypothetical protein JCM11641_001875 [Rhodosporidiobolus odoratus]